MNKLNSHECADVLAHRYIGPVPLDSQLNGPEEQDGFELQVMGWGITSWGSKVASPVLMGTTLEACDFNSCCNL